MSGDVPTSSYLDHLPALLRADPFTGAFLRAFEAVLTGLDGEVGLEQTIGRLGEYLDPARTDPEFLPWLAGWVALDLRADLDVDTGREDAERDAAKRAFIAEAVPLYRRRGTPAGLKRLLEIYLRPTAASSVVRDDVEVIDGFAEPAHFFQVQLTLSDADPDRLRTTEKIARAIIEQEKPAHTFYALRIVIPTMRLVEGLQLGVNTRLGTRLAEEEGPGAPG